MSLPYRADVFEILEPRSLSSPLVYSSPHSGDRYPVAFIDAADLPISELRRSSDLYVDELLLPAVDQGVPLLRAHFPRCFVDVNREPLELDPGMFNGRLPAGANTRSSKVLAGYGVLARLVAENQPIYRQRLPVIEALERIEGYYRPFHAALDGLMAQSAWAFGEAVLVDWHSMPAAVFPPQRSVDIVIGDRNGTSCAPGLTATIEEVFRAAGLTVQRNLPYAGGFITQRHGQQVTGSHAVQIEINRSLYMDEASQTIHAGFGDLRRTLRRVTAGLQDFLGLRRDAIAAE